MSAGPDVSPVSHPRLAAIGRKGARFLADGGGASAVEFALVVLPFLMMCLGILQFVLLHYTQSTLSDALYVIASQPRSVTGTYNPATGGTKADYRTTICGKNAFASDCTSTDKGLKVERWTLTNLPTQKTVIADAEWQGTSGDVVVLRASLAVPKIVAFIPTLTAQESVIYKLP